VTFKPVARAVFQWMYRFSPGSSKYWLKQTAERLVFRFTKSVHELPPIFHYWSNTYLRPEMERFGFSSPNDFFVQSVRSLSAQTQHPLRILSLGCGRGELELAIAKSLQAHQVHFEFVGLDLTKDVIDSASRAFEIAGLGASFRGEAVDLNRWKAAGIFDVVIANQSLHHMVELEHLFTEVKKCLSKDGKFLISDMIGRNGHALWPEMLKEVENYWQKLPMHQREDAATGRIEARYYNHDSSKLGFEGIRAQDILPLLNQHFEFEFFFPFGGLVVPFVERRIGRNFSIESTTDIEFVDALAKREAELFSALDVKPTQMLGALTLKGKRPNHQTLRFAHMTPASCIRPADHS